MFKFKEISEIEILVFSFEMQIVMSTLLNLSIKKAVHSSSARKDFT